MIISKKQSVLLNKFDEHHQKAWKAFMNNDYVLCYDYLLLMARTLKKVNSDLTKKPCSVLQTMLWNFYFYNVCDRLKTPGAIYNFLVSDFCHKYFIQNKKLGYATYVK